MSSAQNNRGTLFVEDAVLLKTHAYDGGQFVLRLHAPKCSSKAVAGSFVHVQCDASIPMRRPLSIMRVSAADGWIDILFKVVGSGLASLGAAQVGDTFNVLGPIGHGFVTHTDKSRPLLIGGGVGLPPMIFLAEQMLADTSDWTPTVLLGSEIPFPFELTRSSIATSWLSADSNASMQLLEEWGVTARLASLAGFDGCFDGFVTDLARRYLNTLTAEELARTEIFSCGPTPMLQAVAVLAAEYALPCQVSLEEFMACALGGCAGCTVEIQTENGPAMKRVCVDGPVFDASQVFT